jgi:predicted O-methyltransferase YrrM
MTTRPRFIGFHNCQRHVFFFPLFEKLASRFSGEPLKILEIGSLFGASALSMARAAEATGRADFDFAFVDLFETDLEGVVHHIQIFRYNLSKSPFADRSTVHIGESRRVMPMFAAQSFHLVYIDADHTFEGAAHDLQEAQRLIKPGGYICGDDLELTLEACDAATCKNNPTQPNLIDPRTGVDYHPGVTLAVQAVFGDAQPFEGFFAYEDMGNTPAGRFSSVDLKEMILRMKRIPLLDHLPEEGQAMIHRLLAEHAAHIHYG